MLPLARELIKAGTEVILAANSLASINDVTAAELRAILQEAAATDQTLDMAVAEEGISVVESGNDLPVIDLLKVNLLEIAVIGICTSLALLQHRKLWLDVGHICCGLGVFANQLVKADWHGACK